MAFLTSIKQQLIEGTLDSLFTISLPCTTDKFRQNMDKHALTKETVEKISRVLVDIMLPPIRVGKEYFTMDRTLGEKQFKESDKSHPLQINMQNIKEWYQSREVRPLVERVLNDPVVKSMGSKKICILNIANMLWKEMEVVEGLYVYAQLLRQASLHLANVHEINPKMHRYSLINGELIGQLEEFDDPQSGELFLFDLWFMEESNPDSGIDFSNKRVIKKMLKKIEVMEAFSRSENPEVALRAKDFLHKFIWVNYAEQANNQNKRIFSTFWSDTNHKSKLIPVVYQLIPLFAMVINAMNRTLDGTDHVVPVEDSWIGYKEIPYSLSDRLNWITADRLYSIVEHAVESNYFERQRSIILQLQKEYGSQTQIFDRHLGICRQPAVSSSSSSSSPKMSVSKGKQKATFKPNASSSSSSTPMTSIDSIEDIEEPLPEEPKPVRQTIQDRFAHILSKKPFKYEKRVKNWQRATKHNDLESLRQIREKGGMPYKDMNDDQLRVMRFLHNIPMPIEKIVLDPEWKERYTYQNERGFSMISHMKMADAVFSGVIEVGFAKENPQLIVHRYFRLQKKRGSTFTELKESIKMHKWETTDQLHQEESEDELLWNDVTCKISGFGPVEILSMEKEGIKLSILPLD